MRMITLLISVAALLMTAETCMLAPKSNGLFFTKGVLVLPEPQCVNLTDQWAELTKDALITAAADVDPFVVEILRKDLDGLESGMGIKEISLRLAKVADCGLPAEGEEQGYKVVIGLAHVEILAPANAGLFYGVQTLTQLFNSDGRVPVGEIVDWPDLQWRAVHWDTKHHQDRFEYYQQLIPKLASYKINAIVLEIEDKLAYELQPIIAAPGAFTKDQICQLADLARKYYIDFVPLVQGLGHVRYILKHPEYAHLRELPESTWQFCPLKEETFKILFDLYDEAIEATGTKRYFHIGGDESYDLATCPACKEKAKKIGRDGIYLIWLKRVAEYLQKKGLEVIIWDDMVLKFNDQHIKQLPQNVIYMRWNYGTTKVKRTKLFDQGYRCMVAPATQCTTPLFPDYENRLPNIAYFVPSGHELGALGELCTAWDDAGLHMETFVLGYLASAEYAWSGGRPGLDEYRAKFLRSYYGPNEQDLQTVYNLLSLGGHFWYSSRGESAFRRERGVAYIRFPEIPDENLQINRDWGRFLISESAHASLSSEAGRLSQHYTRAEEVLLENLQRDVKNKVNLEILLSITRMMKYNTQLLQARTRLAALFDDGARANRKGDVNTAFAKLKQAKNVVSELISEMRRTREFLESTWAKTQYTRDRSDLGKPAPYYVDRFRLHFAELSGNFDYLFQVEKYNDLERYETRLGDVIENFEETMKLSQTESWREQ